MDITLDDTGRIEEAIAVLRAAIKDRPGHAEAHHNLAMFLLSSGRFPEGWTEYRWRLELPEMKYKPRYAMFPVPQWDGEDLAGKRVLVWLDQGIGDQILQASLLPDLIAEAGAITVYCHPRLKTLLSRVFPSATIVKPTELKHFDFDVQMSFSDLGARYRKSFADFPARCSYLRATPLARYTDGLTVGVSWCSANPKQGSFKSIPPRMLQSMLTVPGVTFVNLQYGEAKELPDGLICDATVDAYADLDRFASQVAACDLVVSTSNTTVHVAGALGVPTIALLPQGPGRYWYWFADRQDCLWYSSVTLLRQPAAGDWESLVAATKRFIEMTVAEPAWSGKGSASRSSPECQKNRAPMDLDAALARIRELECAIEPILPWAACDNFEFNGIFLRPKSEYGWMQQALTQMLRETAYVDIAEFKALQKVMRDRWFDGAHEL